MFRRFLATFAAACAVVNLAAALPASALTRAPLDYRAYDRFNAIRDAAISDDGRYFAYALTPEEGDPTLIVRNLATGAEVSEARGTAPHFTGDSAFVVYTIVAPFKDVEAAKKAKKPEEQQPKNGLGVLELATGSVVTFERVKSVRVARDAGHTIAWLEEATPKPLPAVSSTPLPTPTPTPSATPTPAPKADKKKDDGTRLVVRDLVTAATSSVNGVTEYAISDDDRILAFATQGGNGDGNAVTVRDLAAQTSAVVLSGNGRYKDLALAHRGARLAFLSDVRTYASDVPRYDAYVADLTAAQPIAELAVADGTPGLPRASAPSVNRPLAFSKDGDRLLLGTAAAPTPLPSGTPVPIAVDLWTYKDLRLQSAQAHDAADERKRTYLGVYDVRAKRYAQLGSPTLKTVVTNQNPRVALGLDERPYAIEASWTGEEAHDLYAVALRDGSRKLIARKAIGASLSPGGAYVLVWDAASRHWAAIRTSDGKRTLLALHAPVAFFDETDDHPAPPPPYGIGGWLEGDRGVIVYDRYDPWLVDPATGNATNLTRGAGRRANVVYSVLQTDAERETFASGKPFLLSLSDQRTYASGFARLPFAGGTPVTLLRAEKLVSRGSAGLFGGVHERIDAPLVARHADRALFTEESFREFRDYWSSDMTFAQPRKVTNANPQLATYTWGHESLIDYTSADGKKLRAVLLTPDGLDPKHVTKKYPMLVYFYERWSDQFHAFYAPAPGYPNLSRYVSNGYVVLLPDIAYTTGHPGKSALHAILPAVDTVVKRGYVDPKRIGIAGHSWAAYQINYLITQTDRFRAVEAGAAVTNMTSAYGGIRLESGNVRESQYEEGQSRIGATPWDHPDLYLENSGLFHIRNIHTPYLTMHNDADGAVPFSQGVEFITAMRRLGKPAYMFVFNGKDHNLRNTPADRDDLKFWAVHFDEWFDYWLKGAARPSWFDGVDYLHKGERDVRPLYGESDASLVR